MALKIRAIKGEDIRGINEMRRARGVFETLCSTPSERYEFSEQYLASTDMDRHLLVAETPEGTVVGMVGLECNKAPRLRHSGMIAIMVHQAHQGQGVGGALMDAMLDLADNWLMLHRLTLTVFTDNERAISLYKSKGFEIEGTLKSTTSKGGRYADEHFMARIKNDSYV